MTDDESRLHKAIADESVVDADSQIALIEQMKRVRLQDGEPPRTYDDERDRVRSHDR